MEKEKGRARAALYYPLIANDEGRWEEGDLPCCRLPEERGHTMTPKVNISQADASSPYLSMASTLIHNNSHLPIGAEILRSQPPAESSSPRPSPTIPSPGFSFPLWQKRRAQRHLP